MTTAVTSGATDRCGAVRASLFYRAPVFSETSSCVLGKGHESDHQDALGGSWYVIPLNLFRAD
ncbi:hypothetical protein Sipo8835_36955 [Streptomyces ipomoeae]|jgi:hypothetical protein|uniref:Uncharacterized protein n=2 Tax=Streptomyces ipomoeae TaxID=103232 RepID=L1KU74_9ACTN|nr:hypothetical protein [Streptomyces ipomoeae]EKX63943.1 hypothetical protein STRIP9103_04949 [Streptomyces ipomoeae 91-03]MDX2824580.1 hypothetical protein [Streptomyces ipomoeae]MDX2877248.1 hypothetical protein [Streptomyces ipomoeae]MDX2932362.1 hypothetical protein [Streptomyces ipomoeae]TQE21982.1 hypothetical protein Sipo8835_36955 [Streptomyces ipomoeae]